MTEASHLRTLRVLDLIFYQRMKKENLMPREELARLFPNLPELIEIHSEELPPSCPPPPPPPPPSTPLSLASGFCSPSTHMLGSKSLAILLYHLKPAFPFPPEHPGSQTFPCSSAVTPSAVTQALLFLLPLPRFLV